MSLWLSIWRHQSFGPRRHLQVKEKKHLYHFCQRCAAVDPLVLKSSNYLTGRWSCKSFLLKAKKTLWPFMSCSCINQEHRLWTRLTFEPSSELSCPVMETESLSLTHAHTHFSTLFVQLVVCVVSAPNSQMCSSSKHHSLISSGACARRGRQKINSPMTAGPPAWAGVTFVSTLSFSSPFYWSC